MNQTIDDMSIELRWDVIKAENERIRLCRQQNVKYTIDTFTTNCDTIINYFNDRLTNASAEAFNVKIKDLQRQFRGINDTAFFLFRLSALYG